jgi:ABC-type uncharacterized transport system ATPase subunit
MVLSIKSIFNLLNNFENKGAGKTTTISILNGLLKSTGGKVNVYGYDIEEDM